jgi:hypothetical protein
MVNFVPVRLFNLIVASLSHLFNMINAPNSRNQDNILATENSISAVGKIIRTYKDAGVFDANSIISLWIGALPIIEDVEEAPETYSILLELINSQHPAVVNASQIPQLVSILTRALPIASLFHKAPEALQQLQSTLRNIVNACDPNTKQQIWNSISNEQKQYLASQGLV